MLKKIVLMFSVVVLALLIFPARASATVTSYEDSDYLLMNERPYKEDKETKIIDHVVYKLHEYTKDKKKYKYYEVYDWFDTDKAAKTVKEIKIVPEIDGIKVTHIQSGFDTSHIEYNGTDYYYNQKNYSVKKVTIPNTITHIGQAFFSVLDGVEELTIPASVKTVTKYVMFDDVRSMSFYGMESLKKVTFLGDVEYVGGFENCKKLEKVVFKGSVKNFYSYSFKNCVSLKSIEIPKTVEWIGDEAFKNTAITSVTLSANVRLGDYQSSVFEGCKKLTKVVFTGGGKKDYLTISDKCFYNCTALKTVEFPKVLESLRVEYNAFKNCKAITTLKFPATCEELAISWGGYHMGAGAFMNCTSLKTITFPTTCQKIMIGEKAFRSCTALKALTFPTTCKKLIVDDDSFRGCTALKTITFPKNSDYIEIGYRVFRDCKKLTKVSNTDNIIKIYGGAFRDCVSLTSFTVSDKTKFIGKNAFYGCKKLKTVTVNSKKNAAKIYENAFYGTVKGIKFVAKNETAAKKWKSALSKSGLKNMKVAYVKYVYV